MFAGDAKAGDTVTLLVKWREPTTATVGRRQYLQHQCSGQRSAGRCGQGPLTPSVDRHRCRRQQHHGPRPQHVYADRHRGQRLDSPSIRSLPTTVRQRGPKVQPPWPSPAPSRGDTKVGDTVTLSINGNTYTGTVAAGQHLQHQRPGQRSAGRCGQDRRWPASPPLMPQATGHCRDWRRTSTRRTIAATRLDHGQQHHRRQRSSTLPKAAATVAVNWHRSAGDVQVGDTVHAPRQWA